MEILFFVVIPIFLAIWSKYSEDKKLAKAQAELKARREEELDWIYIKEVSAYGLMTKVNFNQWLNQYKFILQNSYFLSFQLVSDKGSEFVRQITWDSWAEMGDVLDDDEYLGYLIYLVEKNSMRERGLSCIDYSMWWSNHYPIYQHIYCEYNFKQDLINPNFYFNCLAETQASNIPSISEKIGKFENQIRELKKQKEQVVTIGEGIKIQKQISKLEGKTRELCWKKNNVFSHSLKGDL